VEASDASIWQPQSAPREGAEPYGCRHQCLRAGGQRPQDEQFPEKTRELKARFAAGTPLDELIPEAFALVRESSRRKLGMRHFDVQLIGGLALNAGKISEMRTGEGKTLMATLPA